jgi:hypothetical protein
MFYPGIPGMTGMYCSGLVNVLDPDDNLKKNLARIFLHFCQTEDIKEKGKILKTSPLN